MNDPLAAEKILLDGIKAQQENGNERDRSLTRNLLILYIRNDSTAEAETLLQCVKEEWLADPDGTFSFWHIIDVMENHPPGRAP
jgi:hypothetical protein